MLPLSQWTQYMLPLRQPYKVAFIFKEIKSRTTDGNTLFNQVLLYKPYYI